MILYIGNLKYYTRKLLELKHVYNHMDFIFQFVNVVYHIDWFVDIKESLHSWDKDHLVMVYDFFNMLLDSVC